MSLCPGRRPIGKIFRVLLALGVCLGAQAQAPPAAPPPPAKTTDPLNRESPQSSVYSFLQACHAHNYGQAFRHLDLRKLPMDQRLKQGPELSRQLEQILDSDAQFDVAALSRSPQGDLNEDLPPNRERVDSFTLNGRKVDLQLERVTFRSGLQVWLFSADSVALIPQLAQITSGSPIEPYLPAPLVSWKLMDTSVWRWIALLLMAAILTALSRPLAWCALLLAELVWRRFAPQASRGVLGMFSGPLRLLFVVAGLRAGMEWVRPAALLRLYLARGLTMLFFAAIAWLCMRIADLAMRRLARVLATNRQTFSYSVLPLASRALKITIVLLTIAAVLSDWGYNTTTILAGLGVGGLAIALAAQKTIENLFGGVAVISDRPVFVGDVCKFGDRVGIVEDIGLRSTRLRTPDRTLVTVPNGQFSSMTLENLSKRDKMLFHITLNLRRDTTPDQVRMLLASITKILTEHGKLETGSLPVRFVGVGTYSLDLEVSAYVLTPDGDEFLQIQQDLLLSILDAVEAAGTALALPTQASISYAPSQNGTAAPERSLSGSGHRESA